MTQFSRLVIEVEIVHEDGEPAAQELAAVALARVKRALREERADCIISSTLVEAIPDDDPPVDEGGTADR